MMKFERPKTAQEAVLREMRDRLLDGRLKPGEAIRPDRFGEELGVSAVPVREALRILEGEGQVEHKAHRGYIINDLSLKELEEIFRIREILEGEAIRCAMPMLDEGRMATIREAAQIMETPGTVVYDLVRANRLFHFTFFEAADMPRLVGMIRSAWDVGEPRHFLSPTYMSAQNRERINAEHRRIIAALEARDVKKMLAEMNSHRKSAFRILVKDWDRARVPQGSA